MSDPQKVAVTVEFLKELEKQRQKNTPLNAPKTDTDLSKYPKNTIRKSPHLQNVVERYFLDLSGLYSVVVSYS